LSDLDSDCKYQQTFVVSLLKMKNLKLAEIFSAHARRRI